MLRGVGTHLGTDYPQCVLRGISLMYFMSFMHKGRPPVYIIVGLSQSVVLCNRHFDHGGVTK